MIATSAPLRRRESAATMRSGPCGSTTASSSITVPRWRRPGAPIILPVLSITSTGRSAAFDRGHDRRARLDRALERRAVVRAGPHVEHHEHRRAAARFVLAHHQMPAARGRPPVHVAEVVAGRVLAQACGTRRSARSATARAAARGRGRARPSRAAAGSSRTRGYTITSSVPSTKRVRCTSAERIGDRDAQRPDLEAAAAVGGEAVRGARLLAGVQRREQEARRAPAAVERVVDRERGACRACACDDDVDPALHADLEPLLQLAPARRARGVAHADPHGRDEQREQRRRTRAPRAARGRGCARRRTARPPSRRAPIPAGCSTASPRGLWLWCEAELFVSSSNERVDRILHPVGVKQLWKRWADDRPKRPVLARIGLRFLILRPPPLPP